MFKKGDTLVCIDDAGCMSITWGNEYHVVSSESDHVGIVDDHGNYYWYLASCFELKEQPTTIIKKHKYADVLIAVAEGREVEYSNNFTGLWNTWDHTRAFDPLLLDQDYDWRVKPAVPDDIVEYRYFKHNATLDDAFNTPNVKFVYNALDGKLKDVQMINQSEKE